MHLYNSTIHDLLNTIGLRFLKVVLGNDKFDEDFTNYTNNHNEQHFM